jgi:hypothetical protein
MQERVAILRDTIKEMEYNIDEMIRNKKHLQSTFTKSNKNRRHRIAVKVNLLNHQIESCWKIIRQSSSELYSLGVIK